MFALARLRILLARRPAISWFVVLAAAAVAASVAWSAMQRVDAARRAWVEHREVWVAAGDVAAGSPLTVVRRDLPDVAIPPAAVVDDPSGRPAAQRVDAGAVVTAGDVGTGLLTSLPDGWRAIAVSTDPARVPAEVGHHVAIYAEGIALTDDGIVLDVTDGTVTVAVPADAAGSVAQAARNQTAVVAVRWP